MDFVILIVLFGLFLYCSVIYFSNVLIANFSTYEISKDFIKHRFLFFNEFTIPMNQIISMRKHLETPLINENPVVIQVAFPYASYLVITYSKDNNKFTSNYAYTSNPRNLKEKIENAKKAL